MIIEKYEGSVYVSRESVRANIWAKGSRLSYFYRSTDIKPLLERIKR